MYAVGRQVGGQVGKGGIGVLLPDQHNDFQHDHYEHHEQSYWESQFGIRIIIKEISRRVFFCVSCLHLLCYEVTFHAYRHMYLRSLDAASRGSKGGDVGFFPPTLTAALPFPTPIPPFSASSSSPSTSARFVPGAGFSRIPRPEDGEGYKI